MWALHLNSCNLRIVFCSYSFKFILNLWQSLLRKINKALFIYVSNWVPFVINTTRCLSWCMIFLQNNPCLPRAATLNLPFLKASFVANIYVLVFGLRSNTFYVTFWIILNEPEGRNLFINVMLCWCTFHASCLNWQAWIPFKKLGHMGRCHKYE